MKNLALLTLLVLEQPLAGVRLSINSIALSLSSLMRMRQNKSENDYTGVYLLIFRGQRGVFRCT